MTKTSHDLNSEKPRAFHVMLKPRGAVCNLACDYCFYLSKESLYPRRAFRMSDGVLEAFTRQYVRAQRVPEVTFAWQGGEPTLMGLGFFQRAMELQGKHRRPGMRLVNAMQTNGTLLDDDWCRFFRAHDFLIGLSLDGPPSLHDEFRRDKGGGPTCAGVLAGLELLKQHGVEFNILACVSAANSEHPLEVYQFLRDVVGARFIQFIPVVKSAGGDSAQAGDLLTDCSVTGRHYGQFLSTIFDEWVRRDVGRVFVQIFDVALAAWAGQRPGLCVFEPTCGLALALEHNGDLYACDHYVEPGHLLGNVTETPLIELVTSEQQQRFGQEKLTGLPRLCQACDVRFVCNGGCPRNRRLHTPDGEGGLNALCEGYQAFFRHIDGPMRFMAAELAARRAPANAMRYLAEQGVEWRRGRGRSTGKRPRRRGRAG